MGDLPCSYNWFASGGKIDHILLNCAVRAKASNFGKVAGSGSKTYRQTNNSIGEELATEHLIALGHQRIACLAWPEGSLTGRERLRGYLEAMG